MCARATSNRNEQAQANISGRNIMEAFSSSASPLQTQEESISSCAAITPPPPFLLSPIPSFYTPFAFFKNKFCIYFLLLLLHLKFFCLHLKLDGAARPGVRVYLTFSMAVTDRRVFFFYRGEPPQNRSCPLFLSQNTPGTGQENGLLMDSGWK